MMKNECSERVKKLSNLNSEFKIAEERRKTDSKTAISIAQQNVIENSEGSKLFTFAQGPSIKNTIRRIVVEQLKANSTKGVGIKKKPLQGYCDMEDLYNLQRLKQSIQVIPRKGRESKMQHGPDLEEIFKYPYDKKEEAEDFLFNEPPNGLVKVKQPFS